MVRRLLAGTALALSFGLFPAVAQDSAPAPAQAPAADAAAGPADIIVTANKRAENIQKVPVAVTPLSQAQLSSRNIVNIGEFAKIAPSLSFVDAPSPTTTMFVIRGVGTFAFNDALEQSVGLVVDGVPLARLVGSVSDAVDMQQVQVLRGPQGTLFGKNATAGVISLDYNDPNFTPSFTGRAFVGSYAEHRIQGTINAPIIDDKLAARLTGWYFTRDGYLYAPFQSDGNQGGFRRYGGRLKVLATPTPDWRIVVTGEFRHEWDDGPTRTVRGIELNQTPTAAVNPATGLGFGQPVSDLERAVYALNQAYGVPIGPNNFESTTDFPESTLVKQQRAEIKSVNSFGSGDLTTIASYVHTRSDARQDTDYTNSNLAMSIPAGAFTYNGVTNVNPIRFTEPGYYHQYTGLKQATGEMRYANSAADRFRYTVGLFFYHLDVLTGSNSVTPLALSFAGVTSPTAAADYAATEHTTNYAAFSDLAYDAGPLTFFAGGRVSREMSHGRFDRGASQEFPGAATVTNGGVLHVTSPTVKITDFSYRGGVQWHLTKDVMLYASASKAYKGPGLNFGSTLTAAQFALNGGIVGKETARSYEIGARTQWFDHQLTLNLTGYYAPFTNFQVTTVLPTQPTSFATVNAPEILSKGVELEFAFAPRYALPGFTLDGNLTYTDARYKDFQNAPCWTGQAVATAATTTPGICSTRGGANVQSLDGFRTVGAPAWVYNLTGGYEHKFGGMRGFGQVHLFHTTKIQFGQNNNPDTIQSGYSLVDLTAGFGPASKKWTVSGYIRNVANKHYVSRISFANPTINQTQPFGALRTGGVALDVAF